MTDLVLATDDGARLAVQVEGPEDGPTVVLVHGFAGSVDLSWRGSGVIDRLVAAGRRVVAYDLRGHGASSGGGGVAAGDARMVEDLFAVVGRFGADVVVGYSMGAAIVLLALERGLPVRAAVVGATPAASLAWTEDDDERVAAAVHALTAIEPPDDPGLGAWVAFLEATGADRFALAAVLAGHRPVVEAWEDVAVPVTVVAGADDTMAAPSAEVAARLRAAEVVVVPGDHLTAVAHPDVVEAVLRA